MDGDYEDDEDDYYDFEYDRACSWPCEFCGESYDDDDFDDEEDD